MDKSQSKIDVLRRKIQRLQSELTEECEGVMKEMFKQLFEDHPKLISVSWKQTIPSFNDGDACYFAYYGMDYSPCCIMVDDEEVECEGPGEDSDWWATKEGSACEKDIWKLNSYLNSMESQLEDLFGSYALVTAKKDGFSVEEYYDY